MQKITICLTGGGTAGHVIPHFALLDLFKENNIKLFYIGSNGIEKQLIKTTDINFFTIKTGKLRRYFSWKNFTDIFNIALGTLQALFIMFKNKPDLIFSKGGFVAVPVCVAGFILRVKIITHESDLSPGLATKIISKMAFKVLCTFQDTLKYFPTKGVYTGSPTRKKLFNGSSDLGFKMCKFDKDKNKKVILVMGGSLGAQSLNEALYKELEKITESYQVIHLAGKNKLLEVENKDYQGFEYISEGLENLLACADLIISRAGANAIFEFLALKKPMILVPLVKGSRGDQIENAAYFTSKRWANTLTEEEIMAGSSILENILKLDHGSSEILAAMREYNPSAVLTKIVSELTNS